MEKKILQITIKLPELGIDFDYETFYKKLQDRSLSKKDICMPMPQDDKESTFTFEIKKFEGYKVQISPKGSVNITFPETAFEWPEETREGVKIVTDLPPAEEFLEKLCRIIVEECDFVIQNKSLPVTRLESIASTKLEPLTLEMQDLLATQLKNIIFTDIFTIYLGGLPKESVKLQFFKSSFLLNELIGTQEALLKTLKEFSEILSEFHNLLKNKKYDELEEKISSEELFLKINRLLAEIGEVRIKSLKELIEKDAIHI
jgi:hypothetical protein